MLSLGEGIHEAIPYVFAAGTLFGLLASLLNRFAVLRIIASRPMWRAKVGLALGELGLLVSGFWAAWIAWMIADIFGSSAPGARVVIVFSEAAAVANVVVNAWTRELAVTRAKPSHSGRDAPPRLQRVLIAAALGLFFGVAAMYGLALRARWVGTYATSTNDCAELCQAKRTSSPSSPRLNANYSAFRVGTIHGWGRA